jgi:hypothetical protein
MLDALISIELDTSAPLADAWCMAEPGRRSKHTMVFMVPTDEHDFGARLVEDLGHQATWSAVLHRPVGQRHDFPLLLAALDVAAGRRQAHLQLTGSDGNRSAPSWNTPPAPSAARMAVSC